MESPTSLVGNDLPHPKSTGDLFRHLGLERPRYIGLCSASGATQAIVRRSIAVVMPACLVLATVGVAVPGRAAPPSSPPVDQAELPGPSAALFANQPYRCVANVYVDVTGRDTHPGTAAMPWATLARANASAPVAGTCINVAPGAYAAGVTVTSGGNAATPTGYVVYRCTVLNSCKITSNGTVAAPTFTFVSTNTVNYVMIDGFELAASSQVPYGTGIWINNTANGAPTATLASHHIWMLNNIIHGYGEAGIATNESDWVFALHNSVYNNAGITCDAQGSGIGLVVSKAAAGYQLTEMDKQYAPFRQVVAWNVVHDNIITACGSASNPYNTDGNGIIIDTFNGDGVDNVTYPYQTLVSHNVTYGNGGKGIQVYRSSYVTVANNTSYNNNLDPWNNGVSRGEITFSGVTHSVMLSNIALPMPARNQSDVRCQGATYASPSPCPLSTNSALQAGDSGAAKNIGNTFRNNVTFGGTPPYGWGPNGNAMTDGELSAFKCSANRCNVSPLLSNAAGGNFALQATSPVIGYGLLQPWLPLSGTDVGACHRSLSQCP